MEQQPMEEGMTPIFNDLDHRLSVVKRWGILHTIQSQSVAEHCFNVERMAVRMAKHWFGITDPEKLWEIAKYAHHHDDFEALTGDLPSMVKPYFDEYVFEADHSDLIPVRNPNQECVNIVKLADMLEGWHFLCIEDLLGNSYVCNHISHEPNRIVMFVAETWPNNDEIAGNIHETMNLFTHQISVRHSRRGR